MSAGGRETSGGRVISGGTSELMVSYRTGRAVSARPLHNLGSIGETRSGINPVANLVVGMRF